MGLWQRFTLIFKSKASKALDRAEDPRETLDYSYEKQLELLQKVRRLIILSSFRWLLLHSSGFRGLLLQN